MTSIIESGFFFLVSTTCLAFVLGYSPALAFPATLVSLLLGVFSGVLLGLGAAAGLVIYATYRLTKPSPNNRNARDASLVHAQPDADSIPAAGFADAFQPGAGTPPAGAIQVGHHFLPHPYAISGRYAGIVYTAPASRWAKDRVVLTWPPSPPQFSSWKAHLDEGTLVLRPLHRRPRASPHTHATSDSTSRQTERSTGLLQRSDDRQQRDVMAQKACFKGEGGLDTAASWEQTQQKTLGIPLEGCTVELVQEGLNGRSELNRRAPLMIAHPSWPLLEGETSFYLVAHDPVSKQQWLHALSHWCVGPEHNRVKVAEEAYLAYSALMRHIAIQPYVRSEELNVVQHQDELGASNSIPRSQDTKRSAVAAEDLLARRGAVSQRRGWRRGWIGGKREEDRSMVLRNASQPCMMHARPETSSQPGTFEKGNNASAVVGGVNAVSANGTTTTAAVNLDQIMEQRWMQPRKARGTIDGRARGASSSATQSPVKGQPCQSPLRLEIDPHASGTVGTGSCNVMPHASPRKAIPSDSLPGDASSAQLRQPAPLPPPAAQQQQQQQQPPPPRELPHSHPHPIASASASASASQHPAIPTTPQSPASTASSDAEPSHPTAASLPQGLFPEQFVNCLIARVVFDLIRNPAFAEHVRARVQRQLSRMLLPPWVTSLEVVSIEPGNAAPSVGAIRALPAPAEAILPQVVLDFKYKGSFTVSIECSVDVRDAPAWARLDKAIDKIGGQQQPADRDEGDSVSFHSSVDRRQAGLSPGGASRGDEFDKAEEWDESESEASSGVFGGSGSGGDDGSRSGGEDVVDRGEADVLTRGRRRKEREERSGGEESVDDFPLGGDGGHGSGSTRDGKIERGKRRPRKLFGALRRQTAKRLRQIAEQTATHIKRTPLRVALTFELLEGTIAAWIPPPPGDRLFWAFLGPPKLSVRATPEIGGRLLKYAVHASRVSAWLQKRMEISFTKNMVYPTGGDIPLPLLLPLNNPRSGDKVLGLDEELQRQRTKQGASFKRPKQPAPESDDEREVNEGLGYDGDEKMKGGRREKVESGDGNTSAATETARRPTMKQDSGRDGGVAALGNARPSIGGDGHVLQQPESFVEFKLRKRGRGL